MAADEVTTTTKQETSEVILPPDSTGSTAPALSDIFSQIESGKSEGKTAAEVITESREKEPEKKEVAPKEEVKPEVKAEESDLSKKLDAAQEKKTDDGEVSREKLRAATEEKKEAAKEEKKEVVDDVPEEEQKVLATDKPKTAKRIQAILRKVDTLSSEVTKTKAEAAEKAAKLAELEKKLGEVKSIDPATDAKVKEQLDELAMYRRKYDLEKDPEIKTKFDARVESAEQEITKALTNRNAGQKLLDLIKEEGGWSRFSQSNRQVSISDGEGGTKEVAAAELADQILQALPLGERKSIEAAMMEQFQTKRDRERYFKEQQDNAATYFKNKEAEAQRIADEQQKAHGEGLKVVQEYEKKILESDWLKDKEVDPKATAAEKAAIEEHNKYNAQLRSLTKKAFKTSDLNGLMGMAEDSIRYYDERRTSGSLRGEVTKLKAELAAKQAEIDRFKGAVRTVPKAGSIASSATTTSSRQDARPASITDAFDRLERGENLSQVVMSNDE